MGWRKYREVGRSTDKISPPGIRNDSEPEEDVESPEFQEILQLQLWKMLYYYYISAESDSLGPSLVMGAGSGLPFFLLLFLLLLIPGQLRYRQSTDALLTGRRVTREKKLGSLHWRDWEICFLLLLCHCPRAITRSPNNTCVATVLS